MCWSSCACVWWTYFVGAHTCCCLIIYFRQCSSLQPCLRIQNAADSKCAHTCMHACMRAHTHTKQFGFRAFSNSASKLWNAHHKHLKTHLFSEWLCTLLSLIWLPLYFPLHPPPPPPPSSHWAFKLIESWAIKGGCHQRHHHHQQLQLYSIYC